MTATKFARWLEEHKACDLARHWAKGKTARKAWSTCRRGDWLLWWAARAGVRREAVVLAACACARLALPRVLAGEKRPLRAIETAERWARGEATIGEVRSAADAAYNATAPATAPAADAADAAAYDAAAAAAAAAYDAAAAAAYAARAGVLRRCAELVRARIPWDAVEEAMSGKRRRTGR